MNHKSGWKAFEDVKWGHVLEAACFVVCMVVAVVSVGWPEAPWASLAWVAAAVLGSHLGVEYLDSEGVWE